MKKTFILKLTALLLLAICASALISCNSAPGNWETDFDKAQKDAEEQNKDLLVFFSGTEWDGYSTRLMDTFFSDNSFRKTASKEFILFHIDVPSDQSTMTEAQINTLKLLSTACAINYCPAILAVDRNIRPYYQLEIDPDTITLEDLVADTNKAAETKRAVSELEGKLETAQGAERAKIIDQLVCSVPESFFGRYYTLMKTIPIIDPENESGLVGKYVLVLAEQDAALLMQAGNYSGAIGKFAEASENEYLTIAQKQECLYYSALFATQIYPQYKSLGMDEEAISILEDGNRYMEQAYLLDPESATGQIIMDMLPTMQEVAKQEREKLSQQED